MGDVCSAFGSREMDCKGLENERAMKEPLPFLGITRCWYYESVISTADLFVVAIGISVQKAKVLKVILCEFDTLMCCWSLCY